MASKPSKLLISHRGNLTGSEPARENSPEFIKEALNAGFDVEIDVWFLDEAFYLGHDKPQYCINNNFLFDHGLSLWCHAKSISALTGLFPGKK